ncbi:Predicted phospholipase, patatin/cPLA2 family [Desulfonatronum thiosulfatophilum]|uniref:Predicted phospholipase, patatin/cPLA2 family n=2 Tax=Desulfonatronum thiosulfatophilum TaxID=617002 RepID=A0A1G6AAY0_9BACT|nr:Predicted phospholipase, patatin/cPLA2 family [Desulfonatronum thiosulfatophilum]
MIDAGLVLEGGGLRGVFTSGVLRRFVDEGLWFANIYGVSMGACSGANYVARQPERNRIVNISFVNDSRYLSWMRLLRGGDLFGMEFIFRTIPHFIVPFDYAVFRDSPITFFVGMTDCLTGEAVHVEKKEFANTVEGVDTVFQATASLPLIAKPIQYQGRMVMDGGIADAVPIRKSMAEGDAKRVIVLTQARGYRKKTNGFQLPWRIWYPDYPGLVRILTRRNHVYNETMDLIEEMEVRDEAFVIRPATTLGIGRICRTPKKLYDLYDIGYFEAQKRMEALREYLSP